ncbi:AAA family ATPase [Microbacterium abyssi]|uniref:AAA family ATPase n=1 Tax=Microbacterium abyssi TaxID=2782166 RepID=UPI001889B37D|nr:AAA family ATPase [Microbacterium sp. A18JL241]
MAPFGVATFVFGPNGSGKTSISRALADPSRFPGTKHHWKDDTPLDVQVYNRDFVEKVIEQYSRLEGVFLLGEENVEKRTALEAIVGENGEKPKAETKKKRTASNLTKHRDELASAKRRLTDDVWGKRSDLAPELTTAFDGFNGSKDRFVTRLLEAASAVSGATDADEAVLIAEAQSVFNDQATEASRFAPLTVLRVEAIPGYDLFAKRVVGSEDARLSDLVQRLGNADWVSAGRKFVEQADGVCPFCQQETPSDFVHHLEELFDRSYEDQVEKLQRFEEAFARQTEAILGTVRRLLEGHSPHLNTAALEAPASALELAVEKIRVSIHQKLASPSTEVSIDDLTTEIERINAVFTAANAAIDEHNTRVRTRAQARPLLVERCWNYFAAYVVNSELAAYQRDVDRLEPAVSGIEAALQAVTEELADIVRRELALSAQLVSSKPTIERMNRVLSDTGFTSFRLAASDELEDGYTITRSDGAFDAGSLSEGERTFLSFLYYYHLLRSTRTGGSTAPILAVIDDPISSMDSDVMVVVSALIRGLVDEAMKGDGLVAQVVILTHNVHFHKEITYQRSRKPDRRRRYFTIRKYADRAHAIEPFDTNPIKSSYGRLWDEVRNAGRAGGYETPIGLENTMRRILETYFNVLGDVGQDSILDKFTGDDRLICHSLFMWANGGSHSIFDDNDHSPSMHSVETYLSVFERIFAETKQNQHYAMMMAREEHPTDDWTEVPAL